MNATETTALLFIGGAGETNLDAFKAYLRAMPHIVLSELPKVPETLPEVQLIVTAGGADLEHIAAAVSPLVENGGAWLHIVGLSEKPIPAQFGAQPGPVGPECELRIRFTDRDNPMAERLKDAFYVPGRFQPLRIEDDSVENVMHADWRYSHRSVVVRRTVGRGQVACTTLQAFDHPDVQQVFHRLILSLTGERFGQALNVGILGYAPSVGRLHGLGCSNTVGLELIAACDLNPERLDQARDDFADITCYASSEAFAEDPDVDLVIVATPPNTHAQISMAMMRAGKHVVCEKPLALNRRETDRMVETADRCGVHLSCHQNRRFDEDYLVIRKAILENRIGDLFYMETFVGGFGHPCPHWHSHAPICGGTTYDWGAHYLDWIVGLMPDPVAAVTATRHNRVWQDVTNADQERIQIRFDGGKEAEFIHSEIAAIRKPKWYLLGTEGAIVGEWRDTIVYRSDPDRYFQWDEIPPTEMPPRLKIFRRRPSGEIEQTEPAMLGSHAPTFLPEQRPVRYPFHQNLTDHILTGEPLATPLRDSIKVVAILEAAARSMENGGRVEVFDD